MKRFVGVLIILVLVVVGVGCGDDFWGCGAGEMRCEGNTAQMCSADNHWENWQHCSGVEGYCSTDPNMCSGYEIACCVW